MYWDADNEWLFTEKSFTFKNNDYDLVAKRLDTNKEFTKFQTGKVSGKIFVDEDKDSIF